MTADYMDYPQYLRTLADFTAYLSDQFESLPTTERGQRFAEAISLILPYLRETEGFLEFKLNKKKSHDGGVDIISDKRPDESYAVCQSKLRIDSSDELDSIISKFSMYDREFTKEEGVLFGTMDRSPITYVVATGSDIRGIRNRYEDKRPSSYEFYEHLKDEDRIRFVDGNTLLQWMRGAYSRATTLPTEFNLTSSQPWLNSGEVYLGIVAGRDLISLVDQYGDGLFFENIREWLGSRKDDTLSVNSSIARTIEEQPERMLERNNGITVRGAQLLLDESGRTLTIKDAAVVNGCQTTMCLWQKRSAVPDALEVVVKVVQTPNKESAWRIAQSANFQNPVGRMELELARYLRPQVVARVAADLGEGLKTDRNEGLVAVLNSYTQTEISYALTRYLFFGIFCKKPNQLFQDNYTNIQMDAIAAFFEIEGAEHHLYSTLFSAIKFGRAALEAATKQFEQEEYAKRYSRILGTDRHKYQAYLLILALCGTLRIDLSVPSSGPDRAKFIHGFLTSANEMLRKSPGDFHMAFVYAFKELARVVARSDEDVERTRQYLFSRVKDTPFKDVYESLCMELDTYQVVRQLDNL